MRSMAMSLGALGLLTAFSTAEALQFRSYPSKQLYAYELDATHGVRSVVLQNVAIINDGET